MIAIPNTHKLCLVFDHMEKNNAYLRLHIWQILINRCFEYSYHCLKIMYGVQNNLDVYFQHLPLLLGETVFVNIVLIADNTDPILGQSSWIHKTDLPDNCCVGRLNADILYQNLPTSSNHA